jgi:hypothetical protein
MHCKVALLGAQSTSGKREAQVVGADRAAVLIYNGSRRTEGERTLIIMTIRDGLGAIDEIVRPVSVMMEGEDQSGQGPGYGGQGEEDEKGTWKP